jgi:hypothetical protein
MITTVCLFLTTPKKTKAARKRRKKSAREGNNSDVEIRSAEQACQPVYESDETAILGQRLVLTPYLLLDQLKQCQEEMEGLLSYVDAAGIGVEQRYGVMVNPLAERLERVHFGVSHLLKLLWRSGLWVEEESTPMQASDGRLYHAVRAPFTDGKPHGRPLPSNAPTWQRELLGLAPCPPPLTHSHAVPRLTLSALRHNGVNGFAAETTASETVPLEEELATALQRAA